MAYSTVQGVPSSTAVVHPWIRHPPSVSRKNTTSKPLLAPRCCHAASRGKDANDTASTFPPPGGEVTTPEDRNRRYFPSPTSLARRACPCASGARTRVAPFRYAIYLVS